MKIRQHLWFDKDMEAAVKFYVSLIAGAEPLSAVSADSVVIQVLRPEHGSRSEPPREGR